jgi:hypothetical protein
MWPSALAVTTSHPWGSTHRQPAALPCRGLLGDHGGDTTLLSLEILLQYKSPPENGMATLSCTTRCAHAASDARRVLHGTRIFFHHQSCLRSIAQSLAGRWPRSKRHVTAWQLPKRASTVMAAAGHHRDFVLFTAAQLSGAAAHGTGAGVETNTTRTDAAAESPSGSDAVQVMYRCGFDTRCTSTWEHDQG